MEQAYYKKNKKAINRNAIGDAITTLAGKACHDGGEEPVFLRVAPHDGKILIDICDEQWRVVEVTPEGWRILERSPVAFIRTVPIPARNKQDMQPSTPLNVFSRGSPQLGHVRVSLANGTLKIKVKSYVKIKPASRVTVFDPPD